MPRLFLTALLIHWISDLLCHVVILQAQLKVKETSSSPYISNRYAYAQCKLTNVLAVKEFSWICGAWISLSLADKEAYKLLISHRCLGASRE